MTRDATLHDVAAAAGVSLETASRVLRGAYKGATERGRRRIAEVEAVAARLAYRPHASGAALRTGRTRQVGVVAHRDSVLCHPVVTEFLAGVNERLEEAGYVTVLARLLDAAASRAMDGSALAARALDAVVVIDGAPLALLTRLRRAVGACVLVNADAWAPRLCVRRDERAAGRTCARALLGLGWRRALALSKQPYAHFSADDRWRGLRETFVAGGGEVEPWRPELPLDRADAVARVRAAARDRVALVASCPLSAMALVAACADAGVRPGLDVGLCAIDEIAGFEFTLPALARVRHDRLAIGRIAGDLVLAALRGDRAGTASRTVDGVWHAGETLGHAPT